MMVECERKYFQVLLCLSVALSEQSALSLYMLKILIKSDVQDL